MSELQQITTLVEFGRLCRKASFHYADDSCSEWGTATRAKHEALEIFDANPDLQQEKRDNFHELWSLNKERPKAASDAE